ncbi:MAG TPA: hypothetical protein VNA88_19950 [Candidatus Kapabacteria bacterium]|nr:hypothetical protein [Candidatus Kapabacteria bacterium]
MSIHEQITALLDGELIDTSSVGELLHVLAVSPEKRDLLVEQLVLKRRFAASAATIVPPARADLAIMGGLAAIDAGFAGGGAAAAANDDALAPVPIAPRIPGWRMLMYGVMTLVLMLGAFGAGYMLRNDATLVNTSASATGSPTTGSPVDDAALAAARDSIARLQRAMATLAAGQPNTAGAVESRSTYAPARTPLSSESRTTETRAAESRTTEPRSSDSQTSVPVAANDRDSDYLIPSHPRGADGESLSRAGRGVTRPGRSPELEPMTALAAPEAGPIGLQLGVRNNFRLSLPRVYGLTPAPTVLLDREVVGSIALGGADDGLFSRVRAGAAFGQTQFSMVFHSNTGGEEIDTIYEQSPQPFYGRAFLAPELVRFDRFAGLLEVGGGYSGAGGFGTVGFNIEYRPLDEIAIHAGASTWLLWTSFREAVDLSTNVNAHLGFMYGF